MIKDLAMRWSWVVTVGPKSHSKSPPERGRQLRRPCEDRAGGQAPESQGMPTSTGSRKRQSLDPPFRAWMSAALPTPWPLTSDLQNCERRKSCCFKPPNLWSLVTQPRKGKHTCGSTVLGSGDEKLHKVVKKMKCTGCCGSQSGPLTRFPPQNCGAFVFECTLL